jgi:hypothetical protein
MQNYDSFDTLLSKMDAWTSLPAVDANDLKVLWQQWGSKFGQAQKATGAWHATALRAMLRPTVDFDVLLFRCMMLVPLFRQGDLAAWQHDAELDTVVFKVAATFTLNREREGFPGNAILDELREVKDNTGKS